MSKTKIKRLRMFAGLNGSGKSTVFHNINRQFSIGHYINADDIEIRLRSTGFVNFYDFDLEISDEELQSFIHKSSLVSKAKSSGLDVFLQAEKNIVVTNAGKVHSYEAALLTAFIRSKLIERKQSFSFETVMSHPSKCEILAHAQKEEYQTYLYFICTKSSEINVERVKNRVSKGGHPVPKDKIIGRYHRSLNLLHEAVKNTHRAFIFDNSQDTHKLILEVYQGKEVIPHTTKIPFWAKTHLLDKMRLE